MSKPRCVFIVEWQHARAAQRGFMQLATIGWRRLLFIHPKPRGTSLKAGLPGAIYILGLRPKRRTMRTFVDRMPVNYTFIQRGGYFSVSPSFNCSIIA